MCLMIGAAAALSIVPAAAATQTDDAAKAATQPTTKAEASGKPAKPTLKSLESTKVKKMTVKWKKVSDADGYDVWYQLQAEKSVGEESKSAESIDAASAASADPVIVSVTPGTATSRTVKNLPGGSIYKVKVRSYRTEKGKKVTSGWSKAKTVTIKHTKWSDLQDKYAQQDDVEQLIFVKYKGRSKADLLVYDKVAPETDSEAITWKKVLSCDAYTGQNGIDKKKEGDRRTPTGVFPLTHAFGVKKDPGSKMDYIKLTKNHYWCGDKDHYNQMIDIRDYPHKCRGEHLIDYTKQYAYAMNIGYNQEGTYGKGSAIFLHCFGYNAYTLGCVAVSPDNMKTILKTCGDKTRICIYWK